MLRSQIIPQPKAHELTTRAAPIGGVNYRDAIASMPEQDAVTLTNWLPDTYGVRSRKGYREWAISDPALGEIKSILSWIGPDTVFPAGSFLTTPTSMPGKLFAADDDEIYDITDETDAPVSVKSLSGNTNAGWLSSTILANGAGIYLLVCSETDGYFYFNGTTWTTPAMGSGAGQVANVNPADLAHVMLWKRRAWFVELNSTRAWYLPLDSITGAAASIDFGSIFRRGGHLAYLTNWTIDAGEGIDDFLVAVSSNGDVAIYKGSDPGTPGLFQLVGTWFIGQVPVGRRGYTQFGGDIVLLSADGINPISYVTRGGSSILQASAKEYSSKIRGPLGEDIRATFTLRGWDMLVHPSERVMMVNVPNYSRSRNRQYALGTTVLQWCEFQDIPISCFGFSAGYAFAGTADGRVLLILNGYFDNVPYQETTGDGIRGEIQTAFSYFGQPAVNKMVMMARPSFLAAATPNYRIGINVNFSLSALQGSPSFTPTSHDQWNVGKWNTAKWSGGGQKNYSEWVGVGAVGFAASAYMNTYCVADTVLTSIDYLWMNGGPI